MFQHYFFFGWLKIYLAILLSLGLLFGGYIVIKKDYWSNLDCVEIPLYVFALVLLVFSSWIFISGSCYYTGVENADLQWRNNYLRDLTTREWPVYYPEQDGYLCYYFTFWLVPALTGKIGGITLAYITQAIYILLILLICFFIISYMIKVYDKKLL